MAHHDGQRDLPVLWADAHQLSQSVVNLVTNAHHAMRRTAPPRRITLTTRCDRASRRVVLEVADTGPGIPPDIETRIFEPFFTTKPAGEGTGLGLAMCRGIVEGHGGVMRLERRPAPGAVFVVELPPGSPPGVDSEPRGGEALLPIRGTTVLVVDDKVEVADVLASMLAVDDHQVETATDGAAALERLGKRTYDLIVSDIRMPGLDGPEFYRRVQRSRPELCRRFVFVTGDTLSEQTRAFLEEVRTPTLHKPFSLADVQRVTQQALRS